jgi:hypothetical protein
LPLAGAVLAAFLAAACTEPRVDEAIPFCASYIPPGTPCVEPTATAGGSDNPEPVEEPVIEEPVETDYEGPRVRQ